MVCNRKTRRLLLLTIIFFTVYILINFAIGIHLHFKESLQVDLSALTTAMRWKSRVQSITEGSNYQEDLLSSRYNSFYDDTIEDHTGSHIVNELPLFEKVQPNKSACQILTIHSVFNSAKSTEQNCIGHKQSESGCIYASNKYKYDGDRNCYSEPRVDICAYGRGTFQCSYEACWKEENERNEILIHIFNVTSGHVTAVDQCTSNEELLTKVKKQAAITVLREYNFMFLSCGAVTYRTQLLMLDKEVISRSKSSKQDGLNINVVLLDSISRSHFYRSLHKTIATFKELNSLKKENIAEVLDFELFQALHGHSAENNHGLFTGHVFPEDLTDEEREELPTGLEGFVKTIQDFGYEFLYQDDMCWEASWGIRMDLGPGAKEYKDLFEKIKSLKLYDTGLMFASCKIIMDIYDKFQIFNLEDDEKVCYNGKQQDAYYLEYIQNIYKTYQGSKNLFTFANLNVAHDAGGIRIQTIDTDLSKFINEISKQKNTLTIILADHGNTYTDFVYEDMEGKYEMFHPSLFMILPTSVQKFIGKSAMESLRTNQNRLMTMIDLHHTLMALINKEHSGKGLLEPVSKKRGCGDLPLILPNLCVCQGWEQPKQITIELSAQVEFAVGMINNIIVEASHIGACKRIVPTMFQNVLEQKDGEFSRLKFDILTAPGEGVKNTVERFSVEVKSKISGITDHWNFILTGKDRLSKFAPYKSCMDTVETFRLCICNNKNKKHSTNSDIVSFLNARTSDTYLLFDDEKYTVKEEIIPIIENELTLLKRSYFERNYERNDDTYEYEEVEPYPITVTFEGVNLSLTKRYSLEIRFDDLNNMKRVTQNNCTTVFQPQLFTYVCTIARIYNGDASYDTTILYWEE